MNAMRRTEFVSDSLAREVSYSQIGQVRDQVGQYVLDQVEQHVLDQVWNQVEEQVERLVEDLILDQAMGQSRQ